MRISQRKPRDIKTLGRLLGQTPISKLKFKYRLIQSGIACGATECDCVSHPRRVLSEKRISRIEIWVAVLMLERHCVLWMGKWCSIMFGCLKTNRSNNKNQNNKKDFFRTKRSVSPEDKLLWCFFNLYEFFCCLCDGIEMKNMSGMFALRISWVPLKKKKNTDEFFSPSVHSSRRNTAVIESGIRAHRG